MNELRRNLDTYNDQDDHAGEDWCENCGDWTGDDDGRCSDCGLRYHARRVFFDNTTAADIQDLLPL